MQNLDQLKDNINTELQPKENRQFNIMTANQWIEGSKSRPIPKMLFGEFWYEHEVVILFADSNLGKSILAVQAGISIASGRSTCGLKNEADAQKILYYDLELSDKQFENRYSTDYSEHFNFPANFMRAEINDDFACDNLVDFEKGFIKSLEDTVIKTGVKVIIIDNLTYLKNETEKAKDALSLMKELKILKNKYNLSILILAHTPKRETTKPLTKNDLAGSKMLINFCDSCFAIGESANEQGLKYIKQIKQRNTEQCYGSDNVILCEIEKINSFLQFTFIGFGDEFEHLKTIEVANKKERNQSILKLHNEGKSGVAIGKQFGLTEGAIRKILIKLQG